MIIAFVSSSLLGQNETDNTDSPNIALNKVVQSISERSYIVAQLGGFNKYENQKHNIEKLIFEFNVSPSYLLRFGKSSSWGMQLNMTINGRMFNENSFPIYSPSFRPSIRFYKNWKNNGEYFQISTVKIAHYSNGQNGDNLNSDGGLNLINGNFSTDFIELNHYWAEKDVFISKSIWTGDVGYQQHIPWITRDKFIDDYFYYGKLTFRNALFFDEIPWFKRKNDQNSLKAPWFFMLPVSVNWGIKNYKTNVDITPSLGVKPYKHIDFYLFINYFYGNDYYNSRHIYKRSAFMIGIITDPIDLNIFR